MRASPVECARIQNERFSNFLTLRLVRVAKADKVIRVIVAGCFKSGRIITMQRRYGAPVKSNRGDSTMAAVIRMFFDRLLQLGSISVNVTEHKVRRPLLEHGWNRHRTDVAAVNYPLNA